MFKSTPEMLALCLWKNINTKKYFKTTKEWLHIYVWLNKNAYYLPIIVGILLFCCIYLNITFVQNPELSWCFLIKDVLKRGKSR